MLVQLRAQQGCVLSLDLQESGSGRAAQSPDDYAFCMPLNGEIWDVFCLCLAFFCVRLKRISVNEVV